MDDRRWWIRVALAILAISELVVGVWAVVDPLGWYKGFPGLGRHWVSVDGPFNHHLTVDAGAGFLAIGVILAVALIWARRDVIQVALVAFLVQAVPHFVYHATHVVKTLPTADKVVGGAGGLGLTIVIAAAALIAVSRNPARTG